MTGPDQGATEPTLAVDGLKTHFFTKAGVVKAVDGVSLHVNPGEILGLVGESGSGKSITGFSILGLIDSPGRIVEGSIRYKGRELTTASYEELRSLRGDRIAMIFQDPMMTLNPVLRVDTQMIETVRVHHRVSKAEARERARAALAEVGIPSPESRLKNYPHELSGGMRQRVAIAIAFINKPDLIIADEPTTALDVTIQAQILAEAQALCARTGTAMIWITHDLAVVSSLADRIAVMYAGRVVETGRTADVVNAPRHPYTRGLINSVPSHNARGSRLAQIPGMTPSLMNLPKGCAFRTRCSQAIDACLEAPPIREIGPGREVRCFNPVAVAQSAAVEATP
ncbi:MAG: ABC transporter ATP-binding protein [Hyphomicrobium sp.]|mgnify:CR=1 FL=1|nr:ABC transporter ATP-binding protein [Hyphomicrobium sp.]MBN9268341.1 ABC transporter ATP-binding protein [Hyphomicrobium sp.]